LQTGDSSVLNSEWEIVEVPGGMNCTIRNVATGHYLKRNGNSVELDYGSHVWEIQVSPDYPIIIQNQ